MHWAGALSYNFVDSLALCFQIDTREYTENIWSFIYHVKKKLFLIELSLKNIVSNMFV